MSVAPAGTKYATAKLTTVTSAADTYAGISTLAIVCTIQTMMVTTAALDAPAVTLRTGAALG